MLQIIVSEKIREQASVLEYRVNCASQKTGFAAESPDRVPIGRAIFPDLKVPDLEHSGFHAGLVTLCFNKKLRTPKLDSWKAITRNIFSNS